jgi:RNA polymerase sigma-70 factor (ECF subfamily)
MLLFRLDASDGHVVPSEGSTAKPRTRTFCLQETTTPKKVKVMVVREQEWLEVERLVRLAQTGDREAFGSLVERFQDSVLAIARRRHRDAEEARELVQEVFLHAMRKLPQLREPACFGAWLHKITVRVSINRATRRPPLLTAEAEVLESRGKPARTPLEEMVDRERRDLVRSAIESLRPIDRSALEAFYLKGKSLAEIASEWSVPLGTIKRRLHVARGRLESSLRKGSAWSDEPTAETDALLGTAANK